MTLITGQILQDRYRIISMLGKGGMGAVYLALDNRLNIRVALKEMVPQPGLDSATLAQLRQQFRQEAQTLARLSHPHLVRVVDFFEEERNAYLTMDYVEGESLAHRIGREGAIPEGQALSWAQQLLSALTYCHSEGIIHRDVKPQNVIIRPDEQVVLVDFGLIKLWDPQDPHTVTAMRGMGTPEYASPEQYDVRAGHTDARSDVYSVGATLYHALTGKAPLTATMRMADPMQFAPLRSLSPQISKKTEKVIMKALELNRSQRWQSAQEMAQSLGDAGPVVAPPPPSERSPDKPVSPTKRRDRLPIWALILGGVGGLSVLALLIVATVLLIIGAIRTEDRIEEPTTVGTIPLVTTTPSPATATPSPVIEASWTEQGPQYGADEAPQVFEIAIDPSTPNVVYAATNQGVYRSTDGGGSWEPRSVELGSYGDLVITSLVLDPANPRALVAGTWGYGLLRSNDGGLRWSRLADPLDTGALQVGPLDEEEHSPILVGGGSPTSRGEGSLPSQAQRIAVRGVAINPTDPEEMLACLADGHGLYHSSDGGTTWSKVDIGTGSAWACAFAPSDSDVRYTSFGTWDEGGGLYRTTDGGDSWVDISKNAVDGTVIAIAIHPTDSNVVLVGTSQDGLYRSADGGGSWSQVGEELDEETFYALSFAPSDSDILYAGGERGVYRSEDAGLTWENADNDFPTQGVRGVAIHPDQPDSVLVGASHFPHGGVYKRTGEDDPFELQAEGMGNTFMLDIEQDPDDPETLYAAAWGAGLFYSTDGGMTWERGGHAAPYVQTLEAVRTETSTLLYAATFYNDQGILRSEDGGRTWQEVSRDDSIGVTFDIEALESDPTHLVAATFQGVRYSDDGGRTWQETVGIGDRWVLRLCEFPDTGQLLAATYGDGVFYTPEGRSWYEANTGIPFRQTGWSVYAFDVACSEDTPGLAYVAARGVYRTSDYGAHWQPVNGGLPEEYFRAVDIVPSTGMVFAGGEKSGVYLSLSRGGSWTEINTGLAEQHIRALQVIGHDPIEALAGTSGRGAWRYTLSDLPPLRAWYIPIIFRGPPVVQGRSYEPNNSLGQARSLSVPGLFYSYITSESDEDYYSFYINQTGILTVELSNIPIGLDYDLELYDGNRQLVGGSYRTSASDERVIFQLSRAGYHYVRVYSGAGSSEDQTYQLAISYTPAQELGEIHGTVTEDGRPAADVPIVLHYDNGYRRIRVSTLTDRSGTYRFQDMPTLLAGHTYTVLYPNYEGDEGRLAYWACWPITEYVGGQDLEACSFDIGDVVAESPAHEAVVGLPLVTYWTRRDLPGDRYGIRLRSIDGSAVWRSEPRQGVDSYTLSELPPDFSNDTPYRWEIWVYNDGGYGVSYYYRQVTFSPEGSEEKGEGPGVPNYPEGVWELPPPVEE